MNIVAQNDEFAHAHHRPHAVMAPFREALCRYGFIFNLFAFF